MDINKLCAIVSGLVIFASIISCSKPDTPAQGNKSIVILYDNDVHCLIGGYPKMAGLRDAIVAADTSYVLVVSSGDYINGELSGSISKGEYIIDIINAVGYDVTTIGNHAFDFGMSRLNELMTNNKALVTCSNFTYANSNETVFAPYVIKTVGSKKIAFIGCSTPSVMEKARGSMYDKQGRQLYDMHSNDMAQMVQGCVNQVKNEGAEYVVILSHLGEDAVEAECEWTSSRLISDTYGVHAVLDGHTHHIYEDSLVTNQKGNMVHFTQTGTSFANIGKLWISSDGTKSSCSLLNLDHIPYSSTSVFTAVEEVNAKIDKECRTTVGHTDYELIVDEPDEVEVIRCKETNFGDLAADAFADITSSPIGIIISATIRHNIQVGDISKGDIFNAFIYDDPVVKLKMSGQALLNFLSFANAHVPAKSIFFPQISGIKYTIDISGTSVQLNDVMVWDQNSQTYVNLNPTTTYEVALNERYVTGVPQFFKDCEELNYGDKLTDRECILQYFAKMPNQVLPSQYAGPQGRINILAQ